MYIIYEAEGDAFCGRMLAMLPLFQAYFTAALPKFTAPNISDSDLETCHNSFLLELYSITFLNGCKVFSHFYCFSQRQSCAISIDPSFKAKCGIFHRSFSHRTIYHWDNEKGNGRLTFGSGIPPHVP